MLCYIGAGSNLGDRQRNIQKAIEYLEEAGSITIKRHSPVYVTQAVGGPQPQGDYLNFVLEIDSRLSPGRLLGELKKIERRIGRRPRSRKWSAREIDLDILLCEGMVINKRNLQVPHPMMHQRFFVLKPLCDLKPRLRHPLLGIEVRELLEALAETGRWKKMPEGLIKSARINKDRK